MFFKRDYLESYKKIMFTGLPLYGHVKMSKDIEDCIYLYKKGESKHYSSKKYN